MTVMDAGDGHHKWMMVGSVILRYCEHTVFMVATAPAWGDSWRLRTALPGDPKTALLCYHATELGSGFRKRLAVCGVDSALAMVLLESPPPDAEDDEAVDS